MAEMSSSTISTRITLAIISAYPLTIDLRLHGELRHARVASPSHPLSFDQGAADADDALTLSLARRGALDRDFVLILDQLRNDSLALLGRDSVEAGKVVALASFCPRLPASEPAPLCLKILVDCSGSMAGDSIEAAKRSLQAIVQELMQGDRFALSRFGSTVEHRARGLWQLTDATQRAAQRWVGNLQADLGGTEMNEALMSTFRLANTVPSAKPSDLLIVTDGEISAIDSVIASAQVSRHRLHIVGIGSSPAESHLRRLAEATGGACDFVAPGEAVEPAVLRMFARLRAPRLSGISLEWPAGNPPTWVSPLPVSVFDGDAVTVFAQFDEPPVGQVRLLGRMEGTEQSVDLGGAEFCTTIEIRETLARLAASQRVSSSYEQGNHSAMQNAAKLAVDYQLVTAHTNFLLIAQRDEVGRPKDMPVLHKVAQMLPAGWSGAGSVRHAVTSDVIPAVVRRAHPKDSSAKSSGSTRYDIPDFLRIPSGGKHRLPADEKRPLHWVDTADYTGLTPLGLCEWLSVHPKDEWPTTYQALTEIGVGLPLVDWLEMVVAHPAGWSESMATAHLLDVMAHPDTHRLLVQSLGVRERLSGFRRRVQGRWSGRASGGESLMDETLIHAITSALEGVRADRWPEHLFPLTVA